MTTLRQEYQDGSYNSDSFDSVLERLVLKLRVIIIAEIRLVRTEQQQQQQQQQQQLQQQQPRAQQQQQPRVEIEQPSLEYGLPLGEPLKPEPAQQQQQQKQQEVLSKDSIFGLSGKNTVRVETTNYNYQYGSES